MQLIELLLCHLAGRAHHDILGVLVHREGNDLADGIFAGEQHDHAVDARGDTGVRAMIVDANDFTRDILGKGDNVTLTDEQLCEIIRDNPAGQDDQCTPFILIRKKQ